MATSPAFQFYAADFLTSAAEFSPAACGLLIKGLANQWILGSLPADHGKLARVLGVLPQELACWEEVAALFPACEDGRLRNRRLERVRGEQEKYRARQTELAKRGAAARWCKQPSEIKRKNADRNADRNAPSPSSSPSSSPTPPTPPGGEPAAPGGVVCDEKAKRIEQLVEKAVVDAMKKGNEIKNIRNYKKKVAENLALLSRDELEKMTQKQGDDGTEAAGREAEKTRQKIAGGFDDDYQESPEIRRLWAAWDAKNAGVEQ